jgi:uncharacterized protein
VPILLAPESGRVLASRPTLVLLVSLFLGHRVLREVDHAAWPTAVAARPAPPRDANNSLSAPRTGRGGRRSSFVMGLSAHVKGVSRCASVTGSPPSTVAPTASATAAVASAPASWLVAIAEFHLVAAVFGLAFGETNFASRIVYALVGLSALYQAIQLPAAQRRRASSSSAVRA